MHTAVRGYNGGALEEFLWWSIGDGFLWWSIGDVQLWSLAW
jgi:hypothetical protein